MEMTKYGNNYKKKIIGIILKQELENKNMGIAIIHKNLKCMIVNH